MTHIVQIDPRDITITPVFKIIEVEDIPQSEKAGHKVMKTMEAVEVRFAGNKLYSPVFPADAFWQRQGNQVVTYAERWPDAYRAFKEGNPQEAQGTPLEMLRPYGVTPEQLSLCRALRIYSIEALHHLEGQQLKSLGMHTNKLRESAAAFLADRDTGKKQLSEIEELRAQIAELKAAQAMVPPAQDSTPQQIAEALKAADDAYGDMTDPQIKDELEKLTGARPRGNPSRGTLVEMLNQALEEKQAA